MVQIEVRDGVEFRVWWHHERSGSTMYATGGYIVCRECGARLGERTSVKLVEKAMELHARPNSLFSCRGRKEVAS